MEIFSSVLIALFIYILGIASPGPSNLAIAYTSIYAGRKAGVLFAFGVTIGSFFWGICAASGLQPLLNQYSDLLYLLKILGGLYFLYLAYNSFKILMKKEQKKVEIKESKGSCSKYFFSGIMMHLLNPKAIAIWIAIIAVALPNEHNTMSIYLPVILCLPFGIFVFIGYAFMFSNEKIISKYFNFKKYIDSFVGVIFTLLGFKLLFDANK
jgi:threonine/homoserine/homoserine lactone efflux protein